LTSATLHHWINIALNLALGKTAHNILHADNFLGCGHNNPMLLHFSLLKSTDAVWQITAKQPNPIFCSIQRPTPH
jgi:hypothetical protein